MEGYRLMRRDLLPRSSKAAWAGPVTNMIKVFGAPISEADAAIITSYLAANYGNGK